MGCLGASPGTDFGSIVVMAVKASTANGNWTWLRSAWEVVTIMTDNAFLESYMLKKIDTESPTREHAMAERPFPKVSRL